MVLEAYYEPQFSDRSHGFRPNRGCHTALESIRQDWKGVTWIIEGDIEKCFDNLDHNLLLQLIGQNIHDQRFLKLLKGMLKAGYLEDWIFHATYSGVPQGGVISPILSNIILDQLDQFVEEKLIPQHTQGKHRRQNLAYKRLSRRMKQARNENDLATYRELEIQRRSIPSGQPDDPDFRRLRYCRYADDFALGFIGPQSEAKTIKAQIQAFLKSIKLTLSEEKTLITHATKDRARFLGYEIHVARNNQRITQHQSNHQRKSRAANGKIMLSVPSDIARQWRKKYTKNGKPTHRTDLLNLSDYEIVTTFNTEYQGLINYYILAQNVSKRLSIVRYNYWISLVRTLAAKHKKKSAWVYRRYSGKLENGRQVIRVTIPRDGPKKPLIATFGAKPIRYVKKANIKDTQPATFYKKTELVQRLLANRCELCQSDRNIEVHHIHKLANVRQRYIGRKNPPPWAVFMMRRNRKTIVVCRNCHHKIHRGTYDGPKLN